MGNRTPFIAWLIFAVLLSACRAPATATPLPPTETSTPLPPPPTSTPLPPPTLTPLPPKATITLPPTEVAEYATEPEQIIGAWSPLGSRIAAAMFTGFDRDGTFRQSKIRADLETNPNVIGTYHFEGDQLVILVDETKLRNLPPCGPDPAIYRVQLLKKKHIRLILVKDSCNPRIETMRREYEPLK